MKKIVMILCIISILLAACTTVQKETLTQPEPKIEEKATKTQVPPKQEISQEVQGLLNKSRTRIKNIYYHYRGPETGNIFFEFYFKEDKIKYTPFTNVKYFDAKDSYDSVFIDATKKTAQSYCEAEYCTYRGKKQDLDYLDSYIFTIFDWIDVTDAKKVGEEVIDDRSTWKLETNKGILWVDTFYGIPLKVESNGKTYRFQQISVNSVQDGDVVPS